MKKQHSSLEEVCQSLVGWQIVKVAYTEVDYFPAAPRPCYHTENPNLHSVDFALCFYNTHENAACIVWQEAPTGGYQLQLQPGPGPETAGQRTWDVSKDPLWQPVTGSTITAVKTQTTAGDAHPSLVVVFSPGPLIQVRAAELTTGSKGESVASNNLLISAGNPEKREG